MDQGYKQLTSALLEYLEEHCDAGTSARIRETIETWTKRQQPHNLLPANLVSYLASTASPDEHSISRAIAHAAGLPHASDLRLKVLAKDTEAAGIIQAADEMFVFAEDEHGTRHLVAAHQYVFASTGERTTCIADRTTLLRMLSEVAEQIVPRVIETPTTDVESFWRHVLQMGILLGSSDVHIEYYEMTQEVQIKIRRDGYLFTIYKIPNAAKWYEQFANVQFVHANINAGEFHTIHDRQIEIHTLFRTYALRLSVIPVLTHSGAANPQFCYRIMVSDDSGLAKLEDLGLFETTQKKLYRLIKQPNGIIYVTGPTGSGKNTTLYALLSILIDEESLKILSIEDPVEKRLGTSPHSNAGIIQVEVSTKRDITFGSALRAFLRHDPDVIFLGETRDAETAKAAIQAAITGHLVFSTLHTNTAADVIPRLTGTLEVDKDLLATSLRGVLSQRLVRRICTCARKVRWGEIRSFTKKEDGVFKKKYVYREDMLEELDPVFEPHDTILIPMGCEKCRGEGYAGRTAMSEVLIIGHENRQFLFGDTLNAFAAFAANDSEPMFETALMMVKEGRTGIDEVSRFVNLQDNVVFREERDKLLALREFEGAGLAAI